jgi:hypothetical protein
MPRQLDAVVWTNLGPKWDKEIGRVPSASEVVEFVREQGDASEAAKYVRNAPAQIDTDYRRLMVAGISWLKERAG